MAKHTQFVLFVRTNCLSAFGHFVNLALKGLSNGSNWKQVFTNFHQVTIPRKNKLVGSMFFSPGLDLSID